LERSDTREVTLADELSLTEHYLDIEKARLGQRLQVVMRVGPGLLQAQVPPLLLQPLVENAIRHGIAPRTAGGTVRLRIDAEQEKLVVELQNDGVPAPQNGGAQRSNAIGLNNVRQRLATLYPENYSLDVVVTPEGSCTVRIALPLQRSAALALPKVRHA
jgi:two-component system sensor histidine kinase AlgZ